MADCKLLSPARAMEWLYIDGLRSHPPTTEDTTEFDEEPGIVEGAKIEATDEAEVEAPAAREERPRGRTPSRARTPTRRCLWAYSEFFSRARERRREELL